MWVRASSYERFMGRWSALVAEPFLAALQVPAGSRWLDVGCGVGTLTRAIQERCAPADVTAADPSSHFLEAAAERAGQGASFEQAPAENLPFDDDAFDAVVSGLALNFFHDVGAGVSEMLRVARPGATVGSYVWDYDFPDFFLTRFWRAAEAVAGERVPPDERGEWRVCSEAGLREAFAELAGGRVWTVEVETVFVSFDELWDGFLLGVGPSGAWMAGLTDTERAQLREAYRRDLPPLGGGPLRLRARAFAVAGSAP